MNWYVIMTFRNDKPEEFYSTNDPHLAILLLNVAHREDKRSFIHIKDKE